MAHQRTNTNPQTLIAQARALKADGQLASAERAYRRALASMTDHPGLLGHLGSLNLRLERHPAARTYLERSAALDPRAEVLLALASACLHQVDHVAAEAACRQAVTLAPREGAPRLELAWVLMARGNYAAAEILLREALDRAPELYAARRNLGTVLHAQGKPAEAVVALTEALRQQPSDAMSWTNLGIVQRSLGQFQAAATSYRRAIQYAPEDAEAHRGLGIVLLTLGHYQDGLAEYEWRLRARRRAAAPLNGTRWNGAPLRGTLLLHFEQGFGDTIQFLRFVPEAARRAGQVVLCVPKPLERLAASIAPHGRLIAHGDRLPRHDAYAYLLSLPQLLGETGPRPALRYLAPSLHSRSGWNDLPQAGRLRIGIVWSGSPGHEEDRQRTIQPILMAPLTSLPNIDWFALQPGATLPNGVQPVPAPLTDFSDTAAAIDHLDLVISFDTGAAHLAGALGRPVWTLLGARPDWRWGLTGSTTPWYPTMRLYRQAEGDDWSTVMQAVRLDLQSLLASTATRQSVTQI